MSQKAPTSNACSDSKMEVLILTTNSPTYQYNMTTHHQIQVFVFQANSSVRVHLDNYNRVTQTAHFRLRAF